MAAESFNLVPAPEQALDTAQRYKLKVLLQDPRLTPAWLKTPASRKGLDALIERVKTKPSMGFYYLLDEPTSKQEFEEWAKLSRYIKERDPLHPSFFNLHPIYAELSTYPHNEAGYRQYIRDFIAIVKPALLSYDHYHFFEKFISPYDGKQYFSNLNIIREEAQRAGIPFMNIIQSSKFLKRWRFPNEDELRWLVYTTLAHGGRGISYFTYEGDKYPGLYRDGIPTRLAAAASKLNAEMKLLSMPLSSTQCQAVYHTGLLPEGAAGIPADSPVQVTESDFILGLFGDKPKNVNQFLIVNRHYNAWYLTSVKIAKAKVLEEFDRTSGKWVQMPPPKIDGWSLKIEAGDGRLFRFQ